MCSFALALGNWPLELAPDWVLIIGLFLMKSGLKLLQDPIRLVYNVKRSYMPLSIVALEY